MPWVADPRSLFMRRARLFLAVLFLAVSSVSVSAAAAVAAPAPAADLVPTYVGPFTTFDECHGIWKQNLASQLTTCMFFSRNPNGGFGMPGYYFEALLN
jgi:hypothetical protein